MKIKSYAQYIPAFFKLVNSRLFLRRILSGTVKSMIFLSLFFFVPGYNQHANEKRAQEAYQLGSDGSWKMVPPAVTPEEIQRIESEVNQIAQRIGFNGNILISRSGFEIYNQSFGYSNLLKKTPLNSETSFQLASVSKQFTAVAILLLRDRGYFELDDTVQKYIPEFPYSQITIKHLLTHTAGLQNYIWLTERKWKKAEMPKNEDVPVLFAQSKLNLNFVPGAKFQYSNAAYAMLALLIEKVTSEHFPDFMHDNIFKPLQMKHTYIYQPDKDKHHDNRAYGFKRTRRGYIEVADDKLDYVWGDKGVFSTVKDLAIWDQALYNNKLLPKETMEEAYAYALKNDGSPIDYGYGFRLDTFQNEKLVYHNGWWHGFKTTFRRYPQKQTTLIILNNTNFDLSGLIASIQDILFPDEDSQMQQLIATETESFEEDSNATGNGSDNPGF